MDGQAPHLRRALVWLAVGFAVVLAIPAAGDAGAGNGAAQLRARMNTITSARHSAALRLYATDSRLARTRETLRSLEARGIGLGLERADALRQLAVARRGVTVTERRLGQHLRVLYEQGEISPLEVFLGADSLDDAISALDGLDRVTASDRRVLAELAQARERLTALDRAIAARQAQIDRLRAAAEETAAALARARDARQAYIARLLRAQQLTSGQLRAVEARAAAARAKADAVASRLGSSVPAAAPGTLGFPTTLTVDAVAYSLPGRTYVGIPVGPGVVAVDPTVIPLGTRMTIPGYGEGVAADIGSAVKGRIIDLWFPTLAQARAWGRHTVTITLH